MSHTIRSTRGRGARPDRRGRLGEGRGVDDIAGELGAATGSGYFDERVAERRRVGAAGTGLVDGVTPAIIEPVAVQAPAQRPERAARRRSFAHRSGAHGAASARSTGADGASVALAELAPGESTSTRTAADELGARAGDTHPRVRRRRRPALRCASATSCATTGPAPTDAAVLLPARAAQRLLGQPEASAGAGLEPRRRDGRRRSSDARGRASWRPASSRSGSRSTDGEAGRDRGRRRGRQRVHGVLHDLRLVLDRRRASC